MHIHEVAEQSRSGGSMTRIPRGAVLVRVKL